MIVFHAGEPSQSDTVPAYLARLAEVGWQQAHAELLRELKISGLDIENVQRWHSAMIHHARNNLNESAWPSVRDHDAVFVAVFGDAAQAIIDEKELQVWETLLEYMTGCLNERDAQRAIVEDVFEGMDIFCSGVERFKEESDLNQQIEDAIGPVAWDDMADDNNI